MNRRLGEFNISNLMIIYIILYTIMPIVQRLTSQYLTTYFYMAVVVFFVLSVFLHCTGSLGQFGAFLLPFMIYSLFTFFFVKEEFFIWGYKTLVFLLPVIVGYYFVKYKSNNYKLYLIFIVIAFFVTMITTAIGCIQNPNASRILATVNSTDKESFLFDMKNIGGYNFVYTIVLLYPVLILSYKMKKVKLIPTVVLALIALFTIISSEYTTALLLFIFTSLLFFTKRNLSTKGIIIITVFSVLFILFFSDVVANFLQFLGKSIDSEAISSRLNALAGGRSGIENSEDNRLRAYQLSFYSFLRSPLFGSLLDNTSNGGGHSFILDALSTYGVLGGICVFYMYKHVYIFFFLPFKNKAGYGYIVWTFIQTIILSLINTNMWLEVLCLFAPILLHWIYGNETETEEANDEAAVDRQLAPGASGGEAIRTTK